MTEYVACYDLQSAFDPYSQFLDQAEAKGWRRWIWGPNAQKWLRLPNTTLLGEFASASAAKAAFDSAVAATTLEIGSKVIVTKHLIGTFSETSFQSDEKADPGT